MIVDRWRKKIRVGVVVCVVLLIGFYGYYQAYDLIIGPVVDIKYPKDNQMVEGDIVIAKGTARNASRIEVNGHPIFITPEGEFREKLPLLGTRTIIHIEAWDRFGRNTVVKHSVLREVQSRHIPDQEEVDRIRRGEEEQETDDPLEEI